MQEAKLVLMLAQSLIGTGFFFIYVYHVRSIFESRTKIQHMNQLEREAMLRREDALYYSFYKDITEEPDFWTAFEKLKNQTNIEYPNSVNVIQRFEVLPELIIGYLYHFFKKMSPGGHLPLTSCWYTKDGRLSKVYEKHCDLGAQPMQFYFEIVWLLGGFTVLILYMYGSLLSESVFGGIYAVISYLMFHKHTAKIYERPAARENFAFPFIFLQIFYTCMCIERVLSTQRHRFRCFVVIKLGILTAISLLIWKFSGIIFAVQVLIMMLPWKSVAVSPVTANLFTFDFALSQLLGIFLAFFLSYENKQYIFGWQLGPALSLAFTAGIRIMSPNQNYNTWQTVLTKYLLSTSLQVGIIDFFEFINVLTANDKSFLHYRDLIVYWIFETKANFVTRLASCNPSYDRVVLEDIFGLLETLIVKPYCMYGVVMLAIFFRKSRKTIAAQQTPEPEIIERAKKYVLEDFLEENRVSMKDMSNKETKKALSECLKLLEKFNYNYDTYKAEKDKQKKDEGQELDKFMDDIKNLKAEITEANDKRLNETESKHDEEDEYYDEDVTEEEKTQMKNKILKSDCSKANHKDKEKEKAKEKEKDNEKSEEKDKNKDDESATGRKSKVSNNANKPKSSSSPVSPETNFKYIPVNLLSFHYIYSVLQMVFFTFVGLNIKKLFFLCFAQGCVLSPAICSKFLNYKHRSLYWGVSLAIFILSLFTPGMENMRQEYYPTTKVHHTDDLGSMLEWVKLNTERNAVFAGPIEIIGTVHLTTRRPIIHHAHLEMPQISERTEQIYSVYSRQQSTDIYNQYSQMKLQYLIVSIDQCKDKTRNECDLLSIWDTLQPTYWKFPQFCSDLISKNVPSFLKVYANDHYAIIKMFSQSVQLNLKHSKMPEKGM